MHNCPTLSRGKNQCTLLIHPSDAEARGVVGGQNVRVRTNIGAVTLPAQLSDKIMPGVISIPHGWGHHRVNTKLSHASKDPGVSLNDILDDALTDFGSGNAAFSGQLAEVELV